MKVGLIGTGLMGLPMAQRLLEADVSLVAYNRTPEKLEPLRSKEVGKGAEIVGSVAELCDRSQLIILMLSNAQAIRKVLLSEEVRSHLASRTILQMSTIGPSESRALQSEIQALGGDYLEAPVLGSIPEVKAGKLLIMVGASPEQFQQWSPFLKHFGPEPRLIGPVGTAAALKLALNQLISSLTTAFAMSLGFVQRQGVEVEAFMDILRQSALHAPTFDKKLTRMVEGNYADPNFPVKHMLKDTNLFANEADAIALQATPLEGVRQILELAQEMGLANEDYSAIFAAVTSKSHPVD